MANFVALFTIHLPNPDAVAEFTGRYSPDGQPILLTPAKIVHFGDTFELNDPEIIANLKAERAIVSADEWKAPVAADPNHWPKSPVGHGGVTYF